MTRKAADLFCGAGGTSTGIIEACQEDLKEQIDLLAINHWKTAVDSHSLNHPDVRHICRPLENIKPEQAVKGGRLNLLAASPECIGHSNAAGGRPRNDQSRCQAWIVCDWLSRLKVDSLLVENVREFVNWGRLKRDGKPDLRYKGEYFKAFIETISNMGYNLEYRVVNAADYGDPTSRKRLLIMARRGRKIKWPNPTHFEKDKNGHRYRSAREIIDWDLKGKSIFNRKRPLTANTLRRIANGLRKFGGVNAEPFLVMLYGTNDARSVDRPTPTITVNGGHIGLAEPFIVVNKGASNASGIDAPVPTTTTKSHLALAQPFITHITHQGERQPHSVDSPLPTITTAHRGELALVEPFIVKYYGNERRGQSIDEPLDTVTCKDRFLLVEPKTNQAVAEIDILFRMLQPHELAAAMSFPKHYKFTGNRGDQVRQIGNAVPVKLARAHARALLS